MCLCAGVGVCLCAGVGAVGEVTQILADSLIRYWFRACWSGMSGVSSGPQTGVRVG